MVKNFLKQNWLKVGLVIIIALAILYFLFVLDVGINSRYFIENDFNEAFLARKTGNCDLFKEFMINDKEKWGVRCIQEKDNNKEPIKNFEIKEFTVSGNSAFLQVELTRDLDARLKDLEKGYLVSYEMERRHTDRFIVVLPASRWLIKNEIR